MVHGVRDDDHVQVHLHAIVLSDELDPQAGQVRHDAAEVSSRGAGPNRYVLS